MLAKCKAIVIKSINYSESSVVLTCYTDLFGIQTYLINGVRSKKGSIRPSHILPLTLLEIEAYHQQNKNMQRIKELRCTPLLQSIHFDMVKSAIGMFMAEIMFKTIREENQPDPALFAFLFNSIQALDLQHLPANFPVFMLLQLSRYLGFLPKQNYSETNNSFDWAEGEFKTFDTLHPGLVEPQISKLIADLLAADFNNFSTVTLTYKQRSDILNCLILFYQNHTDTLHEVKSHKVLAEVLGN
jgi:DNA repair protein RecO (recombination protein O)